MLKVYRISGLVFLFLLFAPPFSYSLSVPAKPDGYVTDKAGMISSAGRQRLEAALKRFEEQTSNQIVVATFPDLDGQSLEDFSIRLAQTWKIGQKGRDNGVIFLVFKNDRKMRIEVGYGLERVLTDALASSIIRDVVAPQFRLGNYEQGISAGLNSMMQAVRGEYRPLTKAQQEENGMVFWIILIFIVVTVLSIIDGFRYGFYRLRKPGGFQHLGFWRWWLLYSWLHALTESTSGGGSWSSGGSYSGSRGGGFSGGGGRFGGGGSSGGW